MGDVLSTTLIVQKYNSLCQVSLDRKFLGFVLFCFVICDIYVFGYQYLRTKVMVLEVQKYSKI